MGAAVQPSARKGARRGRPDRRGYAKKKCPVDTGRLRNSITHVVRASEKAVYIGTNVEYGPYVELGTRHMKAQPYLRPAASGHQGTYRAILKKNLGGS